MTCKLVVFDFDGTLADSFDVFRRCLADAAAAHGFRSVADGEEERVRRMSGRQLMEHLGVPLWKVPTLAVDMRRRMLARIDEVRPFPGAGDALSALAGQGVELALVTSNTRDAARAVLGDTALRLFRHTHCGTAMFGKRFKLRELLWTSRLTPAEIVCIGDEIRDAEAARAVGMDFIGVAWGYTHPAALQTCCDKPLVETFAQLHDMLAR
ncbi:MAG TPA: HAD hydrolase-like protein [Zoogloea sp.]|uniref:HAD hydrolase-like protein n=1 Tax=Zoogloea sp. TaxID=49181 RepID=UPI002C28BD3D|nr:HAD hydrolase-like protein [Zoogloea sp.]HOB47618.1 HAD hydrolase-like protein [Zoogloea sp.]HQA11956.1 HAD hydrolase-like protein [Zoogloea sp.]